MIDVAELKLTDKHLIVQLSWWEKLGARRSHLTVPRRAIRRVEVIDDVLNSAHISRSRGMFHIPGMFAAGTRSEAHCTALDSDHIFSVCRKNDPGLIIELENVSIRRIVISTRKARFYASELAVS